MSTELVTTVDHHLGGLRIRDWLLGALTVSSGAVDAISFLALGKVFTAFMTGNIAFLGMAMAGNAAAPSIVSVLASLAGFAGGVYVGTRIVTPSTRPAAHKGEQPISVVWPLRTTFALGVSLLAQLCFLIIWFATSGQPDESATAVLLAVWALAMGVQSAAVRGLEVGGVFTTAATATFVFLIGDLANRPVSAAERRRLVGVVASLVVGATAGGLLLTHALIYAPVLPFVITAGVIATAVTAFRSRSA
jgi:uncharacterized membrane protein YoaK (UPF0700 family)